MAFDSFWQFDRRMLDEARGATPAHRFRIATSPGNKTVVGYAVTGRAGQRGYLQRLAVAPSAQGQGIGTALIQDSIHWLNRRGVRTAYVNTQERNEGAFQLYQRLGFLPQPEGLVVLSWAAPG
jgi:ribosomal protein S18 acetylase RimI-like enzyme